MSSERFIKSKVGAAFGLVIALMITIVLINASHLNKLSLVLSGIVFLSSIFIAIWVVARLRRENDRRNQIDEELEERVAERSREVVALSVQSTETRMQTLFDISPEFIFIIDTEGVILKTNQYASDNSGYSMDEIVGKWIWDSFTDASKMVCDCNFPKLRKSGNSRADIDFVCKDQRVINMECTAIVVPDQNGDLKNFMMMQRDVTESRKSAEEAKQHLRESAHFLRLSAMGEMASGMAHELNQPLLAIGSYCESAHAMISNLPDAPEALKDIVSRATEQAQRAGEIIRHMRGFIGKEDGVREAIDIDELMSNIVKFVNWEIQNSGIEIDLIKGGNGHRVMANKIQVEQVVINLVMNSIEAIQGEETDKARLVLQTQLKHGDSIEMTVTDNGPGMNPGIIKMAFDQFQTSKKSGMGLGLSISRSIIVAHGGKLWVDEQYKDGARFGFELPIVEPDDEH